jgi:hypothetical protein
LVRHLLDLVRNEKAKWSMPGAGGDRRLIANANQIVNAAQGEIDRATTEAGNNQFLLNANRAFKQWAQTFNSGPIGKLTSLDYEGMPNMQPEQILGRILSNSPTAQATWGRVYDMMSQQHPGVHPAQALSSTLQDAVRQDFAKTLNSGNDGGVAAQRWLTQHARLFANDAPQEFQQMGQEFRSAADNAGNLQTVTQQGKLERAELDERRAQDFALADPAKKLTEALGGNVAEGMKRVVADAQQDPTGAAVRGVAGILAERMLAEGARELPLAGPAGVLSGKSISNWWNTAGQTAFQQLEPALPGITKRAEAVVQAARATDRMTATQGALADPGAIQRINGLGMIMAKVMGAGAFRHLGHMLGLGGTIQIPGIGSQEAARLYSTYMTKLDEVTGAKQLRDAVTGTDPQIAIDLMKPLVQPGAAQAVERHLQHYMLAYPAALNAKLTDQNAGQNPPAAAPPGRAKDPLPGFEGPWPEVLPFPLKGGVPPALKDRIIILGSGSQGGDNQDRSSASQGAAGTPATGLQPEQQRGPSLRGTLTIVPAGEDWGGRGR